MMTDKIEAAAESLFLLRDTLDVRIEKLKVVIQDTGNVSLEPKLRDAQRDRMMLELAVRRVDAVFNGLLDELGENDFIDACGFTD